MLWCITKFHLSLISSAKEQEIKARIESDCGQSLALFSRFFYLYLLLFMAYMHEFGISSFVLLTLGNGLPAQVGVPVTRLPVQR